MTAKHVIPGLVVMGLASAAMAGGHYVEVWNPPEARGAVVAEFTSRPGAVTRNLKKRKRPGINIASAHSRHKAPVAATPSEQRASAAAAPTFDDIPRQITPEGNVLRVKTNQVPAGVVR
ncbi:hypothetical protein SAMN04487926_12273 [Paraburkholderia steynii]|uniref:Uncharacterized protein n=1 Tax=Paraburkholderia steynii TaxID=1245441 RepID=A0A7Z7BCD1_9BURK|nr:hypothetical protein [Paraburkholderia steynii]SDI70939.1 hypothetical protein SAMN04487926_12273 [Paraburkholderia steynii]